MHSNANNLPLPGTRVRVRVAGRPEVSEGLVERASVEGVLLLLKHPPDLGVMTLLEFLGDNELVSQRRTACMVFRRGGRRNEQEEITVALEFVDLVGNPTPPKETILQRFVRMFTSRSSSPSEGEDELQIPLSPPEGPVVGIDLGTANSCIAGIVDGRVRILSEEEHSTVPSVVHFDTHGRKRVGRLAQDKMILEPTRSVFGSKRFLGRPFASDEVRRWGHFFPYQLVQGFGGTTAVKIGHELHSLEEIAKEILVVLKQRAEYVLKHSINRAVISVPAYFGEPQRAAVQRAGRWAGFHVERLVNEPTAAAIAYGFSRELNRSILVYDLGGGTFDVSILRIDGPEVTVLATGGDPFLGGADFDDRLTEQILYLFEKDTGTSLRDDHVAVQRVRFAAERAKIELSEREATDVLIPNIQENEPKDLRVKVTREQFQSIVGDLIDRTLALTDTVLRDVGLQAKNIDDFVLVGGQTRTPLVKQRLIERFSKSPSRRVHADEAVAIGAALLGQSIDGHGQVELKDILSASIQWSSAQTPCQVLLSRGTPLPATVTFDIPGHTEDLPEGRLQFYRGEASIPAENSFIGALNLDLSYLGGKARLEISPEGLLSVQIIRADEAENSWRATTVDLVESQVKLTL